eukprot:7385870-Prymnesium_polylepis.1
MGSTCYNLTYVPLGVCAGPAAHSLLVVGTRLDENWEDPTASDDPTVYDHFNNLIKVDLSVRGLQLACGGDTQDCFELGQPRAV